MNKTPIYKHDNVYAQEHDELKQYFASFKAHEACKEAIEQAIAKHYHDYSLSREGAREVIAEFGPERTLYVLAATIRAKEDDGRISRDNIQWARAFPLVDDVYAVGSTVRDRTSELQLTRAHPGLIDLFVQQARDEAAISRPIYQGTLQQAKEAGEMPEYRASFRVNQLCQREIEQTITESWDGLHVAPDAVKGLLERFGPERVSYVLANTVQQKDDDERFSGANRSWARTVPMYVPPERRISYLISTHPAKLDDFICTARKQMEALTKEQEDPAAEPVDKVMPLYERIAEEQEAYKSWLLTLSPEEILEHTYEYSVREDIVVLFDNVELSDAQVDALMASPSPLADIYKDFRDMDTSYMDLIQECVEQRANKLIEARQKTPEKSKEAQKASAVARLREKTAAPKPPRKTKVKEQER